MFVLPEQQKANAEQRQNARQRRGTAQARDKGGKSCPAAPLSINQLSKGGHGGCAEGNGR